MFVWQALSQRMISTVPTGLVKCLLWCVTVTEGVMSSLAWLGGTLILKHQASLKKRVRH